MASAGSSVVYRSGRLQKDRTASRSSAENMAGSATGGVMPCARAEPDSEMALKTTSPLMTFIPGRLSGFRLPTLIETSRQPCGLRENEVHEADPGQHLRAYVHGARQARQERRLPGEGPRHGDA